MENLKISGVLRRTLKISFMGRLKKSGVSRRTLKIFEGGLGEIFQRINHLFFGVLRVSRVN